MEPITLILAALAAGAGAGATEAAQTAIGDAYAGLKGLILRRFGKDTKAASALAMFESNPDDTIASYLSPHLLEYQMEDDTEILSSAEGLLAIAKSSASGAASVAFTGSISQRADRGGAAQIGGNTGSIRTSYTEAPRPSRNPGQDDS